MPSGSSFPLLTGVFFREAVRALLRHKLRSALTTLGITIGIAAVVLVVAIGEAGSERAQDRPGDLGDNLVWVEAGSRNVNGVRTGIHGTTSLTVEDAEAIRREVPLIRRVSPQIDGTVVSRSAATATGRRTIAARPRSTSRSSAGGSRAASASRDDDVDQRASKVLIGKTVREQLFGAADPIGEVVRIQGNCSRSSACSRAKGQSATGGTRTTRILLPYTTAQTKTPRPGGSPGSTTSSARPSRRRRSCPRSSGSPR